MAILDPFANDYWLRATLLATAGHTVEVNGAEEPADIPALVEDRVHPLRPDFEPKGWPFIIYQPTGDAWFDNYGEQNVMKTETVLIYIVMREDELEAKGWTGDLESYTRRGYIAISAALQGVKEHKAGGAGVIHGCEVLQPWQRLYGEEGQRVSEMGVIARIWST